MAKKVPPFHLRTIPAAIFDELWVKNLETNEYEKIANDGDGINVDWDDLANKPVVIAAGDDQESARLAIGAGTSNLKIGTTATDAMAGNTTIPSGADLVPAAGTDGQVLKVVSGTPVWATDNNTTYTAMTAAAATAGTSTAANTISALVLAGAIDERLSVLSSEIDALEGRLAALEGGE